MKKDELVRIVKIILAQLSIVENNRSIFKQFCDNGKEFSDGLNLTPAFWKTVSRALVHNLMLELSKIYDQRDDVYGLKKVIDIFEEIEDQESLVKEIKQKYKDNEVNIRNLLKQRNKIWAHSDCKYFLQPEILEHEYGLTWGSIEDLIRLAEEICDRILYALGEEPFSIYCANRDDVILIFETMQKKAKDSEQKRQNRKIN